MDTGVELRIVRRQRGVALLVLLLTMAVGVAGLLISAYDPVARQRSERAEASQVRLARAAEALIAHNLGDDWNPGALPCPDRYPETTGGAEVEGRSDVYCLSSNDDWFIGRLPWRTLDLPREYGRLWYVMDAAFRDDYDGEASGSGGSGSGGVENVGDWESAWLRFWERVWAVYHDDDEGGGEGDDEGGTGSWIIDDPLNPGVIGSLKLNDIDGFAALIIDPGPPFDHSQTGRPSYDPDDYLDGNNAQQDPDQELAGFVDCNGGGDCNDRVYGITVDQLFEPVQRRVLGTMVPLLERYAIDHGGRLPRAAPLGSYTCDADTFRGHIPLHDGETCSDGEAFDSDDLEQWVDSEDAQWILDNGWLDFVVYIVDENCTTASAPACGTLTVNQHSGLIGILAGAGRPLESQDRGSGTMDAYLELAANIDGDDAFATAPLSDEHNDVFLWR